MILYTQDTIQEQKNKFMKGIVTKQMITYEIKGGIHKKKLNFNHNNYALNKHHDK